MDCLLWCGTRRQPELDALTRAARKDMMGRRGGGCLWRVRMWRAGRERHPRRPAELNTKDLPAACIPVRTPGYHVHPDHYHTVRPWSLAQVEFVLITNAWPCVPRQEGVAICPGPQRHNGHTCPAGSHSRPSTAAGAPDQLEPGEPHLGRHRGEGSRYRWGQ